MREAAPIHVGTSGWHCPDWRGTFYTEDLPAVPPPRVAPV